MIRLFESDLASYPYPKERVEDALTEVVNKAKKFVFYLDNIQIYVMPVELKTLDSKLIGLEKALTYINEFKEK